MKKLVLKKEVVARINNDQMNQLRGGYADTLNICQTIPGQQATCGGHTCTGDLDTTCRANNTCGNSCVGTCNFLCGTEDTYNVGDSCQVCFTAATCRTMYTSLY